MPGHLCSDKTQYKASRKYFKRAKGTEVELHFSKSSLLYSTCFFVLFSSNNMLCGWAWATSEQLIDMNRSGQLLLKIHGSQIFIHSDLFVYIWTNTLVSFYKSLRIPACRYQKVISLTLLRSRRLCKIIPARIISSLLVGGSYITKTCWNEESGTALWIKALPSRYLGDILASVIYIFLRETSVFQLLSVLVYNC